VDLTPEHLEELARIVEAWISEGFTAPPYSEVQYDLFEWLGVTSVYYDVRRPVVR
jgi:hypothetical protein